MRSPCGPPCRPGAPRPRSRMRWPSATPAGMRACTSRGRCSTPVPRHVTQGSVMMMPDPPQPRQGVWNENKPWLSSTTPRPPHCEQVLGWVPGSGARAVAGAALPVGGEVQGGGESLRRFQERQGECGLDVGTALGTDAAAASAAGATEHLAEQVAHAVAGDVEVVATGTARAAGTTEARRGGAEPTDLVVLLALGLVAEHVVRAGDLLEPFLRGRVARMRVGMAVTSQLPIRLGDLLRRRPIGHAQDLVIVPLEPLPLSSHLLHLPAICRGLNVCGRASARAGTVREPLRMVSGRATKESRANHRSGGSTVEARDPDVSRGPSPWPAAAPCPSTCTHCATPR